MRKLLVSALVGGVVLLSVPAQAGFDEGSSAFNRGDYATALRQLRPAADQGSAEAQTLLGIMYNKGLGVPRDFNEGARWTRMAADQGNAKAQYNLGILHLSGEGAPMLPDYAMQWFVKAADQGYAKAQYNIGVLYHQGSGVARDYVQALKWYNIAAKQGHKKAEFFRDSLSAKLTPAQIEEAQRLASEWYPKGK